MNATLFNPFTITHPTTIQTSLVSGASFARFDPSGKLLAAGRPDGSGVIWDLDTRATVRWCEGHVKGITAVDWSRNSRYVLTASKDWNIIIWDLASPCDPPQRHTTIRFDAPVIAASFHPRNSRIVLALLSTGEPYIVDLRSSHRGRFELGGEDDGDEKRYVNGKKNVLVYTRSSNMLSAFEWETNILSGPSNHSTNHVDLPRSQLHALMQNDNDNSSV